MSQKTQPEIPKIEIIDLCVDNFLCERFFKRVLKKIFTFMGFLMSVVLRRTLNTMALKKRSVRTRKYESYVKLNKMRLSDTIENDLKILQFCSLDGTTKKIRSKLFRTSAN